MTSRINTVQVVAEMKSLSASELRRIARRGKNVAEAPHGLDYVDVKLSANATDKDLDGVGIAVEVLIIEILDQFAARNHATGMMHEIREQPILVRRKLHGIAVHA